MLTANRVQRFFDSLACSPWESMFANSPWESVFSNGLNIPGEQFRPRIWSAEDSVIFEIDLPGRGLDEIDVSIEQNLLSVATGAGLYPDEADLTFRIRERADGKGTMQFRLPFPIEPEQADVVYHNGVLRITVEKPEEEKPRKLTVKQG